MGFRQLITEFEFSEFSAPKTYEELSVMRMLSVYMWRIYNRNEESCEYISANYFGRAITVSQGYNPNTAPITSFECYFQNISRDRQF